VKIADLAIADFENFGLAWDDSTLTERADMLRSMIRRRQLAGERRRFGYRRLHVMLRREGEEVNHKRVYRCTEKKV